MSLVIVDLRCTTKSAKGCHSAGLNILKQVFRGDLIPRKMVILTDSDGRSILDSMGVITDNTININGHLADVVSLSYLDNLPLDHEVDTYFRLGVCGMFQPGTDYFKPMPVFKNGMPRVVVLSMQHTFLSLQQFEERYKALYSIPAKLQLLGFGPDRSGLFGIEPAELDSQAIPLLEEPYRFMYPNTVIDADNRRRNPYLDTVRFLKFSIQQNPAIKNFALVSRSSDFIEKMAKLYAIKNKSIVYLKFYREEEVTYQKVTGVEGIAVDHVEDDAGIIIHCYSNLSSSVMKACIENSDIFVYTGGLVSFYEAIKLKKVVYNQYVDNNARAYQDFAQVLSRLLLDDYQNDPLLDTIETLLNFFIDPDRYEANLTHVLDLLAAQPHALDRITEMYLCIYERALLKFQKELCIPFLYIEKLNRPGSELLRRYVGRLFRETKKSDSDDEAELIEMTDLRLKR